MHKLYTARQLLRQCVSSTQDSPVRILMVTVYSSFLRIYIRKILNLLPRCKDLIFSGGGGGGGDISSSKSCSNCSSSSKSCSSNSSSSSNCFVFCNMEPSQSDAFFQLIMSQSTISNLPDFVKSVHHWFLSTVRQPYCTTTHHISIPYYFYQYINDINIHNFHHCVIFPSPQNLSTQNIR